jgi:curved DNA-binding protein CbpA
MRDLYRRLGISSTASPQDIQKAVQSCSDAKLKEDATEVLLSESRRKTYDQVHASLTDIGVLRAKLGLTHRPNWQGSQTQDFEKGSWTPTSASQAFEKKIKRQNATTAAKSVLRSAVEFVSPFIVIGLVVGGFIYYNSTYNGSTSTSNPQSSTAYQQPSSEIQTSGSNVGSANEFLNEPAFNEPKLPLPATGTIDRYTNKSGQAPLQIKTSSGANYLVRLENVATGTNVLDVFVRGGTTVDIEVPLGTYQLKYASGQNWYGTQHLFGPETAYNKADTPFRFYIEGQQISGYTVTLYRVSDGILRTSELPADQF